MLNDPFIGLVMVVLTTIIHAFFLVVGAQCSAARWTDKPRFTGDIAKAARISRMFMAIVLEVWLWALKYLNQPFNTVFSDLETAICLSMETFTTVGCGDVVLTGGWKLLASIQAANGVIVFGWPTELIF